MSHRLQSSDPWVLLAIAAAGSKAPAELDEIVAAADMINHATLRATLNPRSTRRGGRAG